MNKVRLVVDDLQVQSFSTDREPRDRGTVRAHDAPTDAVECPTGNPAYDSCWVTCPGSCNGSCDACGASGDCSVDCWYTMDLNCQSDVDCMYTAGGRTPSDC